MSLTAIVDRETALFEALFERELEREARRKRQRLGDRYKGKHPRHFGSENTVVVYGKRFVRDKTPVTNGTFNPPTGQTHKLDELAEAVRSPTPNWEYATETLQDLGWYNTSAFPNRDFYQGFLVQMGAIIQQKPPVVAYIEKSGKGKLPIGYTIRPYTHHPKDVTLDSTNGTNELQKPPYVDRHTVMAAGRR